MLSRCSHTCHVYVYTTFSGSSWKCKCKCSQSKVLGPCSGCHETLLLSALRQTSSLVCVRFGQIHLQSLISRIEKTDDHSGTPYYARFQTATRILIRKAFQ